MTAGATRCGARGRGRAPGRGRSLRFSRARGAGATGAAAARSRRGAGGAAAIDGELAATSDAAARRRLVGALVGIADPASAPVLVRAASSGWVRDRDLLDVIAALGVLGQAQP